MNTLTDYDKQAIDFLHKCNVQFKAEFIKHAKHFADDKEPRDIYKLTLTRDKRAVSFEFGQSTAKSGFYYTIGVQKSILPRELMGKRGLGTYIKTKLNWSFLNNDKSDKIHYPEIPSEYDLLATLQKYEVGTLEDFCDEFGYDINSKKAEKIYEAVCDEYAKVCMIFNDEEMSELQEIQ